MNRRFNRPVIVVPSVAGVVLLAAGATVAGVSCLTFAAGFALGLVVPVRADRS